MPPSNIRANVKTCPPQLHNLLHFFPAFLSLKFYWPPPSFARFCDPRITSLFTFLAGFLKDTWKSRKIKWSEQKKINIDLFRPKCFKKTFKSSEGWKYGKERGRKERRREGEEKQCLRVSLDVKQGFEWSFKHPVRFLFISL